MTSALVRVTGGQTIWPYSLSQLRADEPSRSFSNWPSDAELAWYGCHRVQPTSQPAFDPATQKAVETYPVEVEGIWQQSWDVVELSEAEREAYHRATHPPRWLEFSDALPPAVDELLAAAQATSPRLALALAVGLGRAADGDSTLFLRAWWQAHAIGLVSAELETQMQALASQYDLPPEFIAGLGGQQQWAWPDNPERGQRWTAPDGSRWIYSQPRNDQGQYVSDDPSTEAVESTLQWLPEVEQ